LSANPDIGPELRQLQKENERARQIGVSQALREQLGLGRCALPALECKCEPCRLMSCGQKRLIFSCDRQLVDGGHVPKVIHQGCDRKWCPVCRVRLRKRRQRAARAAVDHALEKHREGWIAHAVFTIPNTPDISRDALRGMFKNLTKWMRRVRQRDNVLGVFACLELTYTPDGGFHPHLHCVFQIRSRAQRQNRKWGVVDWGDLWRELTMQWHGLTGCHERCHFKRASMQRGPEESHERHKRGSGCASGGSFWIGDYHRCDRGIGGGLNRVVNEVAKYVSKGVLSWNEDEVADGLFPMGDQIDVSPVLGEMIEALGGAQRALRCSRGLGSFYGVLAPKEASEEFICDDCVAENLKKPLNEWSGARLHCRGSPAHLKLLGMRGDPEAAALYDWCSLQS